MMSFSDDVKKWSEKAQRNIDLVIKDSAQDVFELMSRRQASVKETGGTFVEGRVPVDNSELINSLEVSVGGSVKAAARPAGETGDIDFAIAIAGAEAGEDIEAVFTAPHSFKMEYGEGRIEGRYFVSNAVQNWDQVVAANARLYR